MSDPPDILSAEQMKRRYGRFYDSSAKLHLDRTNVPDVPETFWPLLAYAEFWGIADDLMRENLAKRAPADVQQNLKEVVAAFDSALDEWLAGPEADDPNSSNEYIAFSAIRMAAYYV